MAEVRILRACTASWELAAGWDQVAHCPRLATGGQATATRPRVSGCATRRRLAWPGPACFGQNTQFLKSLRVRESVSPARLTGGATTRLRGREKSLKVSHFLRDKKEKKQCGEVFAGITRVKSVAWRADLGKPGEVRLTPEALHEAAVGVLKREQSPEQKLEARRRYR